MSTGSSGPSRFRPSIKDNKTGGAATAWVKLAECSSAAERDSVALTAQAIADEFRMSHPDEPGISFQKRGKWWEKPLQQAEVDVSM